MTAEQDTDVAEQARAWVVRLASGEMTQSELAGLKDWCGRSPGHAAAFAEARALWQRLGPLAATFDNLENAEAAAGPAACPPAARPRRVRRRRVAVSAALALAACLLLALFGPDVMRRLQADYVSGADSLRVVSLADGSRVTLDRNSAIAVDFSQRVRRVELLAGEAYFEVKPDRTRPFQVAAAGGVSKAVGTAYAVRWGAEEARVAVTEGRVAVSLSGVPGATQTLGAGEGLYYGRSAGLGMTFALKDRALAWRRNKLVFLDRPLDDALEELDRYLPGRIVLLGDSRRFRPVSGVVDLDRLDEGLAALAATHGLTVTRLTPFLTILR